MEQYWVHNWRMGVQFSENCGYDDAKVCCVMWRVVVDVMAELGGGGCSVN